MGSSFFKKPSWAVKTTTESNSPSTPFYRRSDQVYADIIAAESGKEKEKKKKKAAGEERGQDGGAAGQYGDDDRGPSKSHEAKRRCISPRDESEVENIKEEGTARRRAVGSAEREKNGIDRKSPAPRTTEAEEPDEATTPLPPPPQQQIHTGESSVNVHSSTSARSSRSRRAEERSAQAIISIDSDPEPADDAVPVVQSDSDVEAESDEEFAELARKARERAKSGLAGTSAVENNSSAAHLDRNQGAANRGSAASPSVEPSNSTPQPSPNNEPVVHILITSELENTKSLIVHRKLPQDLGEVRKVWCKRQGFTPEMTASVVLTWKGRRLFDVTTCKSLGIESGKDNSAFALIADDDTEQDKIKVHMEAVTEEMLQKGRRERNKGVSYENAGEDGEESNENEEAAGSKIRITLKSPGLKDCKLRMLPTTRISAIIDTFRASNKIPPDKDVQLLFDGEQLPPSSDLNECDIMDEDSIDARVK
ncbi:hypothetical protein AJ80_08136 [Polytolypa hystricis UAMH7299]|uniref:Ubiquitin-like domain-containing protein n=1 Tax=Polytolypa hystricis (strain UAMH7299) TaxID=1447883 RepID=A0A2B7XD42_POLH7|nr:hypothetical protein AJ80_08136 [Polytolypa hystricis UAMH7299]